MTAGHWTSPSYPDIPGQGNFAMLAATVIGMCLLVLAVALACRRRVPGLPEDGEYLSDEENGQWCGITDGMPELRNAERTFR